MKFVPRLITVLVVALLVAPLAFAQAESAPKITIKVPASLTLDREFTVPIEVNDASGQPMTDAQPVVTFSPEAGVSDDVLFNCSDVDESESCDANDRDVAGVFESVFTLNKSPVTMTVEVSGVTEQAQLVVTQGDAPSAPAATSVPAAHAAEKSVLSPSSVKVGPSPSVLVILLPFALMCLVVTVFVVKTT